jgi:hypothetical protein
LVADAAPSVEITEVGAVQVLRVAAPNSDEALKAAEAYLQKRQSGCWVDEPRAFGGRWIMQFSCPAKQESNPAPSN